jgi:hypothetical protein
MDKYNNNSETPEEKAHRLGVPVIPKLPRPLHPPSDSNRVVGVCGKCGLCLRECMWYCCRRAGCPTGLGGHATL